MHAKCTTKQEKIKIISGRSTAPPKTLSLWGEDTPSQNRIGAYGATILAPSSLDPGWTNFANRTLEVIHSETAVVQLVECKTFSEASSLSAQY